MLFFLDSDTEVAERLRLLSAPVGHLVPLSASEVAAQEIVSLLSRVLRRVNPYVRRFQRIGEVGVREFRCFPLAWHSRSLRHYPYFSGEKLTLVGRLSCSNDTRRGLS